MHYSIVFLCQMVMSSIVSGMSGITAIFAAVFSLQVIIYSRTHLQLLVYTRVDRHLQSTLGKLAFIHENCDQVTLPLSTRTDDVVCE